jgi:hypothetical protein
MFLGWSLARRSSFTWCHLRPLSTISPQALRCYCEQSPTRPPTPFSYRFSELSDSCISDSGCKLRPPRNLDLNRTWNPQRLSPRNRRLATIVRNSLCHLFFYWFHRKSLGMVGTLYRQPMYLLTGLSLMKIGCRASSRTPWSFVNLQPQPAYDLTQQNSWNLSYVFAKKLTVWVGCQHPTKRLVRRGHVLTLLPPCALCLPCRSHW